MSQLGAAAERMRAARAVMVGCFAEGMGGMGRMEDRLAAAVSDALARPGSLVRAVVAYLVGLEMGVPEEAARAVGCGIEYLHTASLIFDDLPAMDDARIRRGAPCLHVVHGEAVAMLAALALINRSYVLMWRGISHAEPARRELASEWVDDRLGVHGMIGGQAYDLRGWRGGQDATDVSEVAARKTADLLRLSLVLPAIIGRGSARELSLLDRLGLLRGLAYQVADDLKDVLGTVGKAGKTGGRDEVLGRPSAVTAEGLAAAVSRLGRLNRMGDRVQATFGGDDERWGMLDVLRVSAPFPVEVGAELLFPPAV